MSSSKKIVKNTIFLYFRMLFTMGVNLYTSRVVLDVLGVSDFGVYSVVSGLTSMFIFLNYSMSGATSRFLTFELGRNDTEKLKRTFSAAVTVHLLIALVIFVAGETIGLWSLEHKLVIAAERMYAARWVFQLSLASAMVTIIQVPFSALLIAHERMNIYAYIEILNSALKLSIVYLLGIGDFDNLIVYAIWVLTAYVVTAFVYRTYCVRNFSESQYAWQWDKEIIYPMLNFFGWDLYGNMGVVVKNQGINILLNIFFGVIVNAAYTLAIQVQGAIMNFSNGLLLAVRPSIVKSYASNDIEKMRNLTINASKFSFLLVFLISFPLIVENDVILHLWLKKVPEYAVPFCQWSLIANLIFTLAFPVTFAIHATGKIRLYSFVYGTLYLLVVPVSYVFLKLGFSPLLSFIVNAVMMVFYCVANVFLLRKLIPQVPFLRPFFQMLALCAVVVALSVVLPLYFHHIMPEGWSRFFAEGMSFVVVLALAVYLIAVEKNDRMAIQGMLRSKLRLQTSL